MLGSLVVPASFSADTAGDMPIVEDGRHVAVIVIPVEAAQSIGETAQDLSEIIGQISGASPPIVTDAEGKPSLVLDQQELDTSLNPLAYHVYSDGHTLYFSGGSDQGVINGVYAFLEKELECRWYVPGPLGEHLPKRDTIRVGQVNLQDEPDFESITGFGRHPDPEEGRLWTRRNRLDGFPVQFHSHNWQNIVPWKLIDEHPDWFAQVGTGRTPLQMCTTHPEVLKTTVAKARRYFDEHADATSFSLSPADNMSFCQCDRCRALDAQLGVDPFEPGASITDRLVYFFNLVAEELEKTHPDKKLAFYAYLNHTKPPKVVKPHPMLRPVLVHTPWDYCMHHPIDDPDCERNRPFADAVIGWSELSPQLYLYDYWGHYNLCGHHGVIHNVKRDLPWLYRHGVVGFYGEMHPQRWTQPLNFYVPARLAWDVSADVDAIVREFYKNMFGPAAPVVADFGQMFEDVMAQVPKDAEHDYEKAFVLGMTPDFFARAASLLDRADDIIRGSNIALEEKNTINDRLRRYRYGMRLSEQLALIKQSRFAGRMVKVIEHLEGWASLLEEIEANPSLDDLIELPAALSQAKEELERLPPYRQIWEEAVPSPQKRVELRRKLDEGHSREVAHALGYWTDWYLVGLWTNPGGDPMDTHFSPEDEVDLNDTYDGRSGEIRWHFYQCEDPYGVLDLRNYFRPQNSEYTVAYAYSEVELRGDADARLDVTCDDDIVLWVNGQHVFPIKGVHTSNDRIRLNVNLHIGANQILAKILNKPHGFKFSVRIVTEDGQPLPELVTAEDRKPPRATNFCDDSDYRITAAKGPYFLCDERVVEDRWLTERFVVPLKKYPDSPLITKEHDWEG
ncbi:MAG: DUF4838 domain-containing protein, partial [Candidatus Omnitrophica bacterium]|nr:DUF4838 domain-containing protein [Candidatus Omnitrophota bacterium]